MAALTLDQVQQAVDEAQQNLEVAGLAPAPAPVVEKDPWAPADRDIRIGDPVKDAQLPSWNQALCDVREAGVPDHGYVNCRRPKDHPPHHPHAYIHANRVVWLWGKEDPPLPEVPDALVDPADAAVAEWTVGMRLSYRNKRDVLVLLTKPKLRHKDIEVLDLGHQRFRKIKRELIVPAREDDPEITAEQMQWVGEFIAKRKGAALEIAKRELAKRSWSRTQMNESLQKIDIAPQPARFGTTVEINFNLQLPDGAARISTAAVRALVEKAIKDLTVPDFTVTGVNHAYGGELREQ